jgi:septal ring factor EnvC (AmiA/AmiB activator)
MGFTARTLIVAAALVASAASCNVATASPEGDAIRAKVHQLQIELDNTKASLQTAGRTIGEQQASLSDAQEQITQVGKERDGWHAYGDDQHDKWMNAERRVSDEKVNALRLGIALGLLSLAVGAYGFLHFGYHVLP